jgi:UDP-N-acetyl-2-amino-2-deoxyglucuronate dehydrogenase
MIIKKIRVAVVGCGRISDIHFSVIKKLKRELVLKAVCDNNLNVLIDHEKKYNVKGYADLQEMLNNEELDLVVLCTPSGLHSKQTCLIASKAINIITEKPMATNLNDALNMIKACDENGVKLFVVKQNRNNSTIKVLKRAIDEKRFGNIKLIQLNVFWTRPQSYYDQAKWRGTFDLDGGCLMNQASHYVDFIEWLFGPVEKVHCMSSTTREIEVEDTAVLNIKWYNGAIGSMSVTMLTYPSNLEGSVTVIGEKGTVKISGQAANKIEDWKFNDFKEYDKDIKSLNYDIKSVYGFGHQLYYENVINVLNNKQLPNTDGNQGLQSLKIILAAYLSADKGEVISLPRDME